MIGLTTAMLIAAGISAAGAIGGGIAQNFAIKKSNATNIAMNRENNAFNAQQAELARNFSATEAQKVRDFEERMSNTSYQRAFEDAKAAGINPTAAVLGVGGASVPSAPTAASTMAQSSNYNGAKPMDMGFIANAANQIGGLVQTAMSLKALQNIVGVKNVYGFTNAVVDAKTAKAVTTASRLIESHKIGQIPHKKIYPLSYFK